MTADTLNHPELEPWLAAMRVNPADSLPRLVFADWLRDLGEMEAGDAVAACRSVAEVEALIASARFAAVLPVVRAAYAAMAEQATAAVNAVAESMRAFARAVAPAVEQMAAERAAFFRRLNALAEVAAEKQDEKPSG